MRKWPVLLECADIRPLWKISGWRNFARTGRIGKEDIWSKELLIYAYCAMHMVYL